MAAKDLDVILSKTRSLVDAANGPAVEPGSAREFVKLAADNYEFELPRFPLANSLAFPNDIFSFSYTYEQSDAPISSVTIDLGDSSRRVSVSGESADKTKAISNLIEKDFRQHSRAIGGEKFRRVTGVCLSMIFLTSLMIGSAHFWKGRRFCDLGMPGCSALGFLLVLLLPWNRFLPGFVLYHQRYSPFFVVRHASQISVVALIAALIGIPVSYFLARRRGDT
ncbi:MAG: hypothetical protein ACM3KL_02225 [Alphaproteobacteria bacterium]